MTAPVIRQFAGTIPDKGQAQTAFDTNVDAFLDWQALQFAPDLVAFGTFASSTAAALVAANLPSLTGNELDAVRVNAAADGVEFVDVTAAGWALLDDADAAAQRTTLGVAADSDDSDLTEDPDAALRRDIGKAYVDAHGVVQRLRAETNAVSTSTATIPEDDTIPQNTEGTEILTRAITPTNSSNKLHIQAVVYAGVSTGRELILALFQDSTANAVAAMIQNSQSSPGPHTVILDAYLTAGTTSETTFKLRIGTDNAATLTVNGQTGNRLFGGVMVSSLTITEIKA